MYVSRMYPAQFQPDTGGFVVTFRDIPEAITQGDDMIDAIAMAVDAIYTASDFYFEDSRQMPEPSRAERGEILIPLYVDSESRELALFGALNGGSLHYVG